MSDSPTGEHAAIGALGSLDADRRDPGGGRAWRLPRPGQYAASLLFVALATGLAFIVEDQIGAPNLTLIFVLPVIAAATKFGWGPSLLATPRQRPRVRLLLHRTQIQPRHRQRLRHLGRRPVVGYCHRRQRGGGGVPAPPARGVGGRCAGASAPDPGACRHPGPPASGDPRSRGDRPEPDLSRAIDNFHATGTRVRASGDRRRRARITPAEEEAANGARDTRVRTRADNYPYPESEFDFWPVVSRGDCGCVLGVNFMKSGRSRPAAPDRFIELVGGLTWRAALAS